MGFVLGGIYQNAMDLGYTSLGGSTHKTLPSVQKAFFATQDPDHFERFEKFSGQMLSSLHTSSILALAMTLAETKEYFEEYSRNTLANARLCASLMEEAGFEVIGPRDRKTDCHVVFVDVQKHCEPIEAAHRLAQANIITHPMNFPLATPRRGLRLGLQELTALGMGETEVRLLVDVLRKLIIDNEDPAPLAKVIADLRHQHQYPTFSYLDDERMQKLSQVLFG